MSAINHLIRWGLVLGLCGTLAPLGAQETGFVKEFKARLGYAPNPQDHLRAVYNSYGLNLGYGVGPGTVGLEVGYFYKTGDAYITSPDASRLAPGLLPVNPAKSVEDKRNEISGFTIRTSFSRAFATSWRWQAGLQFGASFRHQYVGDTQSTPWDAASGTAAWRDFYTGTPRKTGLKPSAYAGVTWVVDKDSSVEFNVMLHNYDAIEYHHFPGTASLYTNGTVGRYSAPMGAVFPEDYLSVKHRMVPHAEIGYVFHF